MDNLIEIKIKDFKSFTEETVSLGGVTCFVGANESGKTNLLDAIHHLSKKSQMVAFTPDELRIGAPNYPDGEIRIRYAIKLDDLLIKDLAGYFPNIVGKSLYLTKIGKPKEDPIWEYSLDINLSSVPDIIEVNKKQMFVREFKQDKERQKIAKKEK